MSINYYKERVCLNVLANSIENAADLYAVAEKHVIVGVLSTNYNDIQSAANDMNKYCKVLENNLSVGLGGGDPKQCKMVYEIAKLVPANHFNQVFTAVGITRGNSINKSAHINALVSPTGIPGMVKISTGPLSEKCENQAIVEIETAIAMVKEMGGNSIKFFPMNGLSCKEELIAVADACAKTNFTLEPTGGIDLSNFEEILKVILNAGVKKVIPHVYSSIINKETGATNLHDISILMNIIKRLVK